MRRTESTFRIGIRNVRAVVQLFGLYIRAGAAANEAEWIPVTGGAGLDRDAVRPLDGNLLVA
ncbi:MAG TPA: hypothetical protein VFB14_01670 [Bryobacteraceae bacterium]|nr:hypothetical protein [Bryobacteraceae bacterium]